MLLLLMAWQFGATKRPIKEVDLLSIFLTLNSFLILSKKIIDFITQNEVKNLKHIFESKELNVGFEQGSSY